MPIGGDMPGVDPFVQQLPVAPSPASGFMQGQVVSNPTYSPTMQYPALPYQNEGLSGFLNTLTQQIAQQRAFDQAKKMKQGQYQSLVNLSKELGVSDDVSPQALADLVNSGYQPSQAAGLLFSKHEQNQAKKAAAAEAAELSKFDAEDVNIYKQGTNPQDPNYQNALNVMGDWSPKKISAIARGVSSEQKTAKFNTQQEYSEIQNKIAKLHLETLPAQSQLKLQKSYIDYLRSKQQYDNYQTPEQKMEMDVKKKQLETDITEASRIRVKQTPGATGSGGTAKLSLDQQDLKDQMKALPDANQMYSFGQAHGLKLRQPSALEGVPGSQQQYYANVVAPAIHRKAIEDAKSKLTSNKTKLTPDQVTQFKSKYKDPNSPEYQAKKAELEQNHFDTTGL
jgi:hypothetical protein